MVLEIVTRKAWGAMPAQWTIAPMDRPATAVWIFYTGTDCCLSREECDASVREMQRYHIEEKEEPDTPFSFLVGGDGLVYEGRGWESSAPEPYDRPDLVNKRYIIGYIDDDFELNPRHPSVLAVQTLIEYGIKNNYIKKDYEKYEWDDTMEEKKISK